LVRTDRKAAKAFHLSFRLIDDFLSVDNSWSNAISDEKGIYPRELKLNETTKSNSGVTFLGMSLHDTAKDKLHIDVYDKRDEFPFTVRNYPHMDSNIPKAHAYGVFTGQLHRYYRICTQWGDFLAAAVKLGRKLMVKGYQCYKLCCKFRSFMVNVNHKFQIPVPSAAKAFEARSRGGIARSSS
jgi:hypothetical protein